MGHPVGPGGPAGFLVVCAVSGTAAAVVVLLASRTPPIGLVFGVMGAYLPVALVAAAPSAGDAETSTSTSTASAPKPASASGRAKTDTYAFDFHKVREWAAETGVTAANGNPVTATTPRIGQPIYDAYRDAQSS